MFGNSFYLSDGSGKCKAISIYEIKPCNHLKQANLEFCGSFFLKTNWKASNAENGNTGNWEHRAIIYSFLGFAEKSIS